MGKSMQRQHRKAFGLTGIWTRNFCIHIPLNLLQLISHDSHVLSTGTFTGFFTSAQCSYEETPGEKFTKHIPADSMEINWQRPLGCAVVPPSVQLTYAHVTGDRIRCDLSGKKLCWLAMKVNSNIHLHWLKSMINKWILDFLLPILRHFQEERVKKKKHNWAFCSSGSRYVGLLSSELVMFSSELLASSCLRLPSTNSKHAQIVPLKLVPGIQISLVYKDSSAEETPRACMSLCAST